MDQTRELQAKNISLKKKRLKGYLLQERKGFQSYNDKNGMTYNNVNLALRASNYVLKLNSDFCRFCCRISSVWLSLDST